MNYPHLQGLVRFLEESLAPDFFAEIKFKGMRAKARALENRQVIPQLSDVSPHLIRALDYATARQIRCFVETVPICFLRGHEDQALETRNIIENFKYGGWNFHVGPHTGLVKNHGYNNSYVKNGRCTQCRLTPVCAGVWKEYGTLFGWDELNPSDRDPDSIVAKVLAPNHPPGQETNKGPMARLFAAARNRWRKVLVEGGLGGITFFRKWFSP